MPEPSSNPHWRQDAVTGQWMLLAPGRALRPHDFVADASREPNVASAACPFCAGNESQTTPTLARYPEQSGDSAIDSDWRVRVVSNLYPILDAPERSVSAPDACPSEIGATMQRTLEAGEDARVPPPLDFVPAGTLLPAIGSHEVIIECPTHHGQITDLTTDQITWIFHAYRDRLRTHRHLPSSRFAMIFKNSGRDAGMSREHLHSQLVALPVIPPLMGMELDGAAMFHSHRGQCVFCRLADEARQDSKVGGGVAAQPGDAAGFIESSRCVAETETLIAYCPFASRVAYEIWIQPRQHAARFEAASDKCLLELAQIVPNILRRLRYLLGSFAYNYVLHTLPFDTRREDHYHWHIEIIPRTSRLAGLEWGSGIFVNTVAPEVAAARLRDTEFIDRDDSGSQEEKTSEKN